MSQSEWADSFVLEYSLADLELSPDGNWYCQWAGYGMAASEWVQGDLAMRLRPEVATRKDETHSALVSSTVQFEDHWIELDVRTSEQIRLQRRGRKWKSQANPWEVAWVLFRFHDTGNFYYFMLKPNGGEIGKLEDGVQYILATTTTPQLRIGEWNTWTLRVQGSRVTVWVDGGFVMDYEDPAASPLLAVGSVALYCEDADVQFDNVRVLPI